MIKNNAILAQLAYREFQITNGRETKVIAFEVIVEAFPENLERIQKAAEQGKHHLSCHNEFGYFEIQWK